MSPTMLKREAGEATSLLGSAAAGDKGGDGGGGGRVEPGRAAVRRDSRPDVHLPARAAAAAARRVKRPEGNAIVRGRRRGGGSAAGRFAGYGMVAWDSC